MPKRGTDHTWQLVKYLGDIAIYAKCKCSFRYCCSQGCTPGELKQIPKVFYPYCPNCGARKKWRTTEIERLDKYSWE